MSLMIIQLAKMTLIVLAIFCTPAITRKFVFQLTAPEASQMMKWGGVMMGGLATVGAKGLSAAKIGQSFGSAVARRELPAASQELTRIARRVGSSDFGKRSKLVQFSKNLIEKQNKKLQGWHLNEAFNKPDGVKSKGFSNFSKASSSLSEKAKFSTNVSNDSKLHMNKEALSERKDPISGRYIYPGQPKPGVLSTSIKAGDRAVQVVSTGTQKVAHIAKNVVQARSINRISSFRGQSGVQTPSRQNLINLNAGASKMGSQPKAEVRREQFHRRVQSVMSQNKKRLDRIFKGDGK